MKYKKPAKSKLSMEIRKQISKQSLRTTEIKNYGQGTSATLSHATEQAFNITGGVGQGSFVYQRVGDEIFLNALRFSIMCRAPTTAGAYTYRILIGYSGEEYSPTVFSTSSLTYTEIATPNAVAGTNSSFIVNKKAFTVLFDKTVDINSNITGVADVNTQQHYLNLRNVRFPYQSGGGQYGKTKNLYCWVIATVVGGTTGTTSCGSVAVNLSLDFRDP